MAPGFAACDHGGMHIAARTGLAGVGLGAAALAYSLWEAHQFTLREVRVEVLRLASPFTGTATDRPALDSSARRQNGLGPFAGPTRAGLRDSDRRPAGSHGRRSLPGQDAGALNGTPGVFVFGSNDYWSRRPSTPSEYFIRTAPR